MNPRKGLVLDANILMRAVLGRRVRELLEVYEDVATFYIRVFHGGTRPSHLTEMTMPGQYGLMSLMLAGVYGSDANRGKEC